MGAKGRKRSVAITLVLAGGAVLSGCSDPLEQRDAYASLQDCTRDWSSSALCEPVSDNRFAPSYYYGPAYYPSTGFRLFGPSRAFPSPNAMDAVPVPPGTVARSPASQAAQRADAGTRWSLFSGSGSSSGARSTTSSSSSRTYSGSSSHSSSRASGSSGTSRGGFGSSGRSSAS